MNNYYMSMAECEYCWCIASFPDSTAHAAFFTHAVKNKQTNKQTNKVGQHMEPGNEASSTHKNWIIGTGLG